MSGLVVWLPSLTMLENFWEHIEAVQNLLTNSYSAFETVPQTLTSSTRFQTCLRPGGFLEWINHLSDLFRLV